MAKRKFNILLINKTISENIFSPDDMYRIYNVLRKEGYTFSNAVRKVAEQYGKAESVIIKYLLKAEGR